MNFDVVENVTNAEEEETRCNTISAWSIWYSTCGCFAVVVADADVDDDGVKLIPRGNWQRVGWRAPIGSNNTTSKQSEMDLES